MTETHSVETKGFVRKVWIDNGCIVCDVCKTICPEVFEIREGVCTVRLEAASTGYTSLHTREILDAARGCPVHVIRFETVGDDLPLDRKDEDPGDSAGLQRRTFVGSTALTIGWAAFGGGLGLSMGPSLGRFMIPNALDEPDPRVRVGTLRQYAAMAPGEVNEEHKPQGIWIIRDGNRIAALNTVCTHLGCIPNWLPNDRKFKCPCHGSGFRPDGINFEGPAPRPLERFRIYIEKGNVMVDKSRKYQYELGQWDQPGSYLEV